MKDRLKKYVTRFERGSAQDGFFKRTIYGRKIRFRVSILPVISSDYERKLESIVVRVLGDKNVILDLKELGLLKHALSDFKKAIEKPQGMVILTGPTGSRKSATLMAAPNAVMSPEINVLTVEEPVDYLVEGARQLKINPIVARELGFTDEELSDIVFYTPVGCSSCHNGYHGRMAIHEVLLFTPEIRRKILAMSESIDEEAIKTIALLIMECWYSEHPAENI